MIHIPPEILSQITPEKIMAVCALIVGLITVATLLVKRGRFIQSVKNINDRVIKIEDNYVNKKAYNASRKSCQTNLEGKIEAHKNLVNNEIGNLGQAVSETKATVKEMCQETKKYREESTKRWIETNKVLAKVSAKLGVK